MPAAKATQPKEEETYKLKPIQRGIIVVPIVGMTPLIPGRWDEKARQQMREAQTGSKVRQKREPKVPEVDAEGRTYRFPDGRPGMPSVNFKVALVGALRLVQGPPMVTAKTAIFVHGDGPDELIEIDGEQSLREDMVRNQTGVADIRYRNQFFPWRAELTIRYNRAIFDAEGIVNLVEAAGDGGVGEWRPSAPKSFSGTKGMFRVDQERNVQHIKE